MQYSVFVRDGGLQRRFRPTIFALAFFAAVRPVPVRAPAVVATLWTGAFFVVVELEPKYFDVRPSAKI
jgi:hypothetical protein